MLINTLDKPVEYNCPICEEGVKYEEINSNSISPDILYLIFTGAYYTSKDKPLEVIEYTVSKGETLWDLYEQYDNGWSWDKWLWEVKRLNGKTDGGVVPGEVVKIYVEVEQSLVYFPLLYFPLLYYTLLYFV